MARQPKVTKEQLLEALRRQEGDFLKVAVELQVDLSTVYRSAARYGIEVIRERRIRAA
jgi:transcriptional regulator of acetoin/glycerol metabolism